MTTSTSAAAPGVPGPGAGKSRNPRPPYHRLTIGVCPDQWGIWFPEDPKQIPWRRTLAEMRQAGFEVMETGPFGYFPTDPKELKRVMDANGFRVVAGTGWGILHKEEAWPDTERAFRAIGETHAALGAEYVVHLPPLYRSDKTWEFIDDRVLTPAAWDLYIANANRLGRILKEDYGLNMVLHPHGDSHIETPEDIARVFAATDPAYVNLCLDTGHIVYGGGDPLELVRQYPDRVTYVHIKAFDPELTRRAHEEDWPFGEAVARGAAVTPPAGEPDMRELVAALAALDKDLYVICEQDLYPADPAFPLPNAIATREFLADCGLGLR
jgi:inosose dehydratase